MCDIYRTLGITQDATYEEILEAYEKASQEYYAIENPDAETKAHFEEIQDGFRELIQTPPPPPDQVQSSAQVREIDPDLVEVETIYSSNSLTRLDEPQRVYVMLSVHCKVDPSFHKRIPANICLVVDRSTSMKDNRLEIVKRNILGLFGQLSEQDVFSLISFNDRAEIVIPPTVAVNLPSLKKSILGLAAEGGTEIFQGLIQGYQMLSQSLRDEESRYLMLLTDGHTYGDESSCYSMARQAAKEGVVIQAMGIGSEWNDRFLDRLTSISGGCAQFINTPEDLQNILARQLDSLESVFAQQLQLKYDKPEDVTIGTIFRLSPDSAPMALESPVSLGNLEYDQDQVLLFEFLVPPQAEGTTSIDLAKGDLIMKLSGSEHSVRIPITFSREITDTGSEEPPPDKIMRAVSRLTLYRLQAKAQSAMLEKNTAEATRYLQNLATHLLSQGKTKLARTVLHEAESIRENGEFSKYGEKSLKYGTRALMLPEDSGGGK